MKRIWKRFLLAEFRPTVALCEGRAKMFRFASRPSTGTLRESELVRILAERAGIPLYSIEASYDAGPRGAIAFLRS